MKRYLKYSIILIFASIILLMKIGSINQPVNIKFVNMNQDTFYALGYNKTDMKILQSKLNSTQIEVILKAEIPRDILFSYFKYDHFNFDEIEAYEKIRTEKDTSFIAAINIFHHPFISKKFYQNIRPAINQDTHLILVNKNYALSKDYVPKDLVFAKDIPLLVDDKERYYLKKEAYVALIALIKDLEAQGLKIYISNAYRSYEKQDEIYTYYKKQGNHADLYSAKPGHSEHQTGLAVDVTCKDADYLLSPKFALTKEGIYIKNHAHLYGFIIRYPKESINITGYQYEPWHLRYVGKKPATIIYTKKLTFEDYLIQYTEMPN